MLSHTGVLISARWRNVVMKITASIQTKPNQTLRGVQIMMYFDASLVEVVCKQSLCVLVSAQPVTDS